VPEGLYTDGAWLNKYLERRIDAARTADDSVDAFVPTADVDRLKSLWIKQAPPPQAQSYSSVEDSLEALLRSRSWRLTAPLRAVGHSLRALRKRVQA
jgi:hypothetical protein